MSEIPNSGAQPAVVACTGLSKHFREGAEAVRVLDGVELEVRRGERVAIVGSSGSGKSTLMHLLGGLDVPSAGSVRLMGQDFSTMSEAARGRLRNAALGFVYQFHHLLPEFSALENVAMPLYIRRVARAEADERAAQMLREVGLGHRLDHAPGELSGGERQRAAIARALVTQPACVLADEPTGNLDTASSSEVFALMRRIHEQVATTFLVVTHDPRLAARCDRVIELVDGRVASDGAPPTTAS